MKRKAKTTRKADRSEIMRAVRSRDTKPELFVRNLAHGIRPGYRLYRRDLPGSPDIAYVGAKKAIFVHGCFWHGHDCARGGRTPKHNRDYWIAKVARNVERDRHNVAFLAELGWNVLTIWECQLKEPEAVADRLRIFLSEPETQFR